MKKKVPLLLLGLWMAHGAFAQGNYVFSGAEAANFGNVSLSTPGGQSWATFRGATPGYFSAVGASPYSNGTDANNVNGYVKQYSTASNVGYTFPVGTGADIRNLSTNGTIASNSIFATAWILGDPGGSTQDPTAPNSGAHPTTSVGTGITAVSKTGEWDWQDISGTGNGVTITVSIPDMTTFATAVNLRLVGWNGTNWQDLSGAANASGNTENSTLSGTMASGITAIGIGTVTIVLPLDLLSFTATESNCSASLLWATANEVNTSYFDIEQGIDGSSFTKIGQLAAQGNSAGKNYSYLAAQNVGLAYYRLKMVDKDGAFKYSPIASLRTTCSLSGSYMNLFPNPVVTGIGDITLSFSLGYAGNAMVRVVNTLGQQVFAQKITMVNGANQFKFSSGILATGMYHIQLVDANGNQLGNTLKLLKQ